MEKSFIPFYLSTSRVWGWINQPSDIEKFLDVYSFKGLKTATKRESGVSADFWFYGGEITLGEWLEQNNQLQFFNNYI